jgi:hypothetical protein
MEMRDGCAANSRVRKTGVTSTIADQLWVQQMQILDGVRGVTPH